MSRAYDDGRYLARTLAATLLDLDPLDQESILAYFKDELRRLGVAGGTETVTERQEQSKSDESGSREGSAGATGPDFSAFIIAEEAHRPPLAAAMGTVGLHNGDQHSANLAVLVSDSPDFDRV